MDFSQGRGHVFDENDNKALREVVYLSQIKTLKEGGRKDTFNRRYGSKFKYKFRLPKEMEPHLKSSR